MLKNPFVTLGYEGPDYFCDREEETAKLTRLLTNGNNVVLMSPRRLGKTGLLYHVFQQKEIQKSWYAFIVDIYSTKSLNELVTEMGKVMLNTLQSKGKRKMEKFLSVVSSLKPSVSFDSMGNPSWNVEMGTIQSPNHTLEQIFSYIEHSEHPCLVAIDEFQQIAYYPEKNVEAVLRTHIQRCHNAQFVFSGSERHLLSEMFFSPARPFYASTSTLSLESISLEKYVEFAERHFENAEKHLDDGVVDAIYERFEGVTWYVQKVLNYLFADTMRGERCGIESVDVAVNDIVKDSSTIYADLLYQLTLKQKELLMAINNEGKAKAIMGSKFLKKYHLSAASSVQTTIKSLMEKQLVTCHLGIYEVYDKFFGIWLSRL